MERSRTSTTHGAARQVQLTQRRILLVNNSDVGSGAGRVAWSLLHGARTRGHEAKYLVDIRHTASEHVIRMREDGLAEPWRRPLVQIADALAPLAGRVRGARWSRNQIRRLARPERIRDYWRGAEEFSFPATWQLLDVMEPAPDLVHCHDLLGDYFDLRALPSLAERVPLILTLHNAWLLTGHCSHSLGCERWRSGCGECPDLRIYPALRRDGTADNWRRKRNIYRDSRLYLSAPCRWLIDMVEDSILEPAVRLKRVIPHGVDLTVFRPGDRELERARLRIAPDTFVLMLTAAGGHHNTWKDFATLQEAVGRLGALLPERTIELLIVGGRGVDEVVNGARIRFLPFQENGADMARFYRAADVYAHCTKADTFPTAVLEALATGTPVVATGVGGIPEQVRPYAGPPLGLRDRGAAVERETGILVPAGDAQSFAAALASLGADDGLRTALGRNAARDAAVRFDVHRQVEEYLSFYEEVIGDWHSARSVPRA
jgi:glycosyltransferase involved in cell wall biosynthesis